jgi:adenosylhomocysteine nucleosidase
MTPLLGIVCGMEAESRALGQALDDPRLAVAITAGRPDRAEAEGRRLVAEGVRGLLSWGIAGGLDPALGSGALLLPDGVIGPGGQPHAFDAALVAACRGAAPPARRPGAGQPPARGVAGALLLAGSDAVLLKPLAKAALRRRTNAAAVDMESHRIVAVARSAKLPCLAIRAVSDPSGRRLPALAADALDAFGRPLAGAVLRGLARRPWDLPALLAAGRDSRAALAALADASGALIPALLSALSDPQAR